MLTITLTEAELAAFFPGDAGHDLRALFPRTTLFPGGNSEALAGFLAENGAEVLLSGWRTPPLSPEKLDTLRYVCHLTGSVRGLVPRSRIEAGLVVTNWGDGAAETVAENVLMLILAALRQTQFWGREMHERGAWRTGFGDARTLFDRKIALHGFGRIARALLPLLAPFRCSVVACSHGVPPDFIRAHGAEPIADLTGLFDSQPDVLVEIEALTPRSRNSVTEAHLRALPHGTVFVNSGRGAVVDETALCCVAAEGRLRVALDVYAAEPLAAASPLRGLPHVTLMPHVGGPTLDRYPAIGQIARNNLFRWLRNEPLWNRIDLATYDAST